MKRGPKPSEKVSRKWSRSLAYAIGLLTADGCLSGDKRHIDFTSKDREQIQTFKTCLGLKNKISQKKSGAGNMSFRIQFGDVMFYEFLESIGLTPAKSKTLSSLAIPHEYFFDFLRGYFDGDGCSYSFYDSVWKESYRFYISFGSAGQNYLDWIRKVLKEKLGINGHICHGKKVSNIQLKYSKHEALKLVEKLYLSKTAPHLKRKYLKISKTLSIINRRRGGEIGRHAAFRTLSP